MPRLAKKVNLTDATKMTLPLPDGKSDHIYWDSKLPGFGLRIRTGDKRTWVAQCRVGTKQFRYSIADASVPVNDAKAKAKPHLDNAQLNIDPREKEKVERERYDEAKRLEETTFGKLADQYQKLARKKCERGEIGSKTLVEIERHLQIYWAPLRATPIHLITLRQIAERLTEIADKHGLFAANRGRSTLSAFWKWAIGQGHLKPENNIVVLTNKPTKEESRSRRLTDSELARVWNFAGDGDYGKIVRLLILTGQRREEIGGMRWSEIDLKNATFLLPEDRSKNKREHLLPLSTPVLEILTSIPKRADRDFVFGEGEGAFAGYSKAKLALDRRIVKYLAEEAGRLGRAATKTAEWRLHDLRRTFATNCGDLGVEPHIVEAILNHVSGHKGGVAGVYNHALYLKQKRAALDMWAEHVTSLVRPSTAGEGSAPDAN